jgi:hypothetical protein
MIPTRPQETVKAWHEALNGRDTERLLELSHPEISVGGPRGTGSGSDLLLAWVERANVTLEPLRYVDGGETIVVEETATWTSPGADEPDTQATVASVFTVSGDVVTSIVRHDDLTGALTTAGLDGSPASGTF